MGWKSTFTAAQKREAVMGVISKRETVGQACRELGMSETTFARWWEPSLEGMEAVLAGKGSWDSREDLLAEQLAGAERTIGQLAPENDPLGKASRRPALGVRATPAAQFVKVDGFAVTTAARVLGVSRQAICDRLSPDRGPAPQQAAEVVLRLVPPVLPED